MVLVFTKRNQKTECHSFPIFGKHGNKKQNQRNFTLVEIALNSKSKLLEKLNPFRRFTKLVQPRKRICQDMIQYCPYNNNYRDALRPYYS